MIRLESAVICRDSGATVTPKEIKFTRALTLARYGGQFSCMYLISSLHNPLAEEGWEGFNKRKVFFFFF